VDLAVQGYRTDEDLLAWLEAHPAASAETRQEVAMAKVPALVEENRLRHRERLLKQTFALAGTSSRCERCIVRLIQGIL